MECGTVIVNNLQIQNPDGSVTEMVFVDDENGKGYSMLKSTYDEMIAKQSKVTE
jgi:hypothetical protein